MANAPSLMLIGLVEFGDIAFFFFSRDNMGSHDQKDLPLVQYEPCNLSHDRAKIDAYRSYESGEITLLFCHVILCDYMIKGTFNLVSCTLPT